MVMLLWRHHFSRLCDDGNSSVNGQKADEAEIESWLPMDQYDLGFWTDMPPHEEDSGSEVVVEDQDPGPVGCSCASCQVESVSRRCEPEGKEVCKQCVGNCDCGGTSCVRCFYKHGQQCQPLSLKTK